MYEFIKNRATLAILLTFSQLTAVYSQYLPEDVKIALVYNITKCIIWENDTSKTFTIGIISDNDLLYSKFSEIPKMNKDIKKPIEVIRLEDVNTLKPANIIYIDKNYSPFIPSILKNLYSKNTLVITDEYNNPGEIMINLKLDSKTRSYTFEYNRANILFQGLDVTNEIISLKGSEIEIRKLYLSAKKLWDEQKTIADSLGKQSIIQDIRLKTQNDSLLLVKNRMIDNMLTIQNQMKIISTKDSQSEVLNNQIHNQHFIIYKNQKKLNKYGIEQNRYLAQIADFENDINNQEYVSDSLTFDILQKKNELAERTKVLSEKETIIQKQWNYMIFLILIIALITLLVFFIFKAYITIKKAKQKIADQKEELQAILEKLQNTQQQLVQSEKMASLGVLVSGIAHEINNPVNFISTGISGVDKVVNKIFMLMNGLKKIKPDSSSNDIEELLEIERSLEIEKSLKQMPKIIENIKLGIERTISITDGLRLYAHVDKEEKSPNDINKIIETSLLLLKPIIKDKVEIIANYQNIPPILVFPSKISQVFVNLLSNAIDAVQENDNLLEKGIIRINSKEQNGKIIVEISDTGKGIPQEIINKIFDPFFTTKNVGKGTGLGLSISLGIIEEHNGSIFVSNNLDKGTLFIIELPVNG